MYLFSSNPQPHQTTTNHTQVIRCSGIIPDLTLGCFRCFMCGA
jgi:hypothetical protein